MKPLSLVCTSAMFLSLMTAVASSAADLNELRLFHGSETDQQQAEASNDQNLDFPGQPITIEETWVQDTAEALDAELAINTVYRYHGFISSLTGIQYLINGVPVTELDTLELISVKQGGRILQLRFATGHVFQLAIGQSIDRTSL